MHFASAVAGVIPTSPAAAATDAPIAPMVERRPIFRSVMMSSSPSVFFSSLIEQSPQLKSGPRDYDGLSCALFIFERNALVCDHNRGPGVKADTKVVRYDGVRDRSLLSVVPWLILALVKRRTLADIDRGRPQGLPPG